MIKFKSGLFSIILIAVMVSWLQPALASEECALWFKGTGIDPSSKDCELDCSSSQVDMGNFSCPSECADLCRIKLKRCQAYDGWSALLKDGAPFDWPVKRESKWSDKSREKEVVIKILQKIPPSFRSRGLKGFYLMGRNPNPLNPGNPASSIDSSILLYDRAFVNQKELPRILVHELSHVLTEHELKGEFEGYKMTMNWNGDTRSGSFIEQSAKNSSEEDFALNIETFIFESDHLKRLIPKAYAWIHKKLKPKFFVERECLNVE